MLTISGAYPSGQETCSVAHGLEFSVSVGIVNNALGCMRVQRLTSTFNSGNPPSTFLSQIRIGDSCDESASQTLNLPPVSSEFRGRTVIARIVGVGNVNISSVDTQFARCCLSAYKLDGREMI